MKVYRITKTYMQLTKTEMQLKLIKEIRKIFCDSNLSVKLELGNRILITITNLEKQHNSDLKNLIEQGVIKADLYLPHYLNGIGVECNLPQSSAKALLKQIIGDPYSYHSCTSETITFSTPATKIAIN